MPTKYIFVLQGTEPAWVLYSSSSSAAFFDEKVERLAFTQPSFKRMISRL